MFFLDLSTGKVPEEKRWIYIDKINVPILKCILDVVGNEAFAHNEIASFSTISSIAIC